MKKRIIIFLLGIVALGISSCNDEALNLNDTEHMSDIAVWSTEEAADAYITAVYKTFTDVSQVANSRNQYYDSYTDLMKSTSWEMYGHPYNKALLQASSFVSGSAGSFDCWEDVYIRIRRANVLLNDLNRYGTSYGEEWCNIRRAEIRLCRAFSYYRLARVYGGVVIRTDISGVNGGTDDGLFPEDVNRKRATEAETWDFIISDLQWAAEKLPDFWSSKWEGRATKKTAYGLISRMALFAKKWQTAIDAAEKVKELGGALANDYAKVFQVRGGQDNSSEILFALNFLENSITHGYDSQNRPFGDQAVYTSTTILAEHVPTAELADMYEFSDGTEFNWNNYAADHPDPYTDREPRFHATIMYNGCQWEGRTIQSYEGGTDGFTDFKQVGSTSGHTCTGYYLRKYLQEGYSDFIVKGSYQYDAMLRYAEVLLNKAEAYAELDYSRYKTEALGALNEVRNRVGLPEKDAATKDAFLTLLRKERCVELAGEGFRYWDLRRWKLAVNVINGQNVHGVKITKSGNSYSYEKVECDGGTPRIFLEKYYYFSLPKDELVNNKELGGNNPQW
ncbi:MAG: RagB/SusD family nutrient uptake outer membrane protein [Dysgonamonadaceae bacterium]|jgi:hypothetical protein|nr:RagB/SusD family nutrient uptake outer membrane protein [Dysgonamonadaceae bacterium]